jgi:hypothetical protein
MVCGMSRHSTQRVVMSFNKRSFSAADFWALDPLSLPQARFRQKV